MSGVGRTEAVSVHKLRRAARKRERELQRYLSISGWYVEGGPTDDEAKGLQPYGLPIWARGVRVERIGPFCFAVIATEERGH
jgi:hypothetical protein